MRDVLRGAVWVAAYELGEALRTRLLQLVLLGYCAGTGFSNWLLFRVLLAAEEPIARQMGVPMTTRPGALSGELLRNGRMLSLASELVGDPATARALLGAPILALWAGAAAMVLLPVVVSLASAASVSTEVRSRSIRYLVCRSDRLAVALGKAAGQLLLAAVAVSAGALVTWVMGMTMMLGNPPAALALALLDRSLRALAFSLPFLGIGMAASMGVGNPNGSRVLSFLVVVGLLVLAGLGATRTDATLAGRVWDQAMMLLPWSAWVDYFRTDPGRLLAAVARSAVQGAGWFGAGLLVLHRRDL